MSPWDRTRKTDRCYSWNCILSWMALEEFWGGVKWVGMHFYTSRDTKFLFGGPLHSNISIGKRYLILLFIFIFELARSLISLLLHI